MHSPAARADPQVRCLFFPLDPAERTAEGIERSIPLGQLADLRDGDVIYPDGRVENYARAKVFTTRFTVNAQHSRSRERQALIREGLLPPTAVDSPGSDAARTAQSKWVLLPASTSDFDFLAVPAFLLFWTYYAPNSRLALSYYFGTILEVFDSLAKAKTTFRAAGNACHLKLGKGHLASDAIPLGRALFDASGKAMHESRVLANQIHLAHRHIREFTFDCGFPFEGETVLVYRAVEYQARPGGPRVRCVLDILECQHPLPWSTLHVSIDQSKRVPGGGAEPLPPPTGTIVEDFDEDDFGELDPEEDPPGLGNPVVLRARKATDFSVPGSGSILIVRRETESGGRGGTKKRKRRALSARVPSVEGEPDNQQGHVAPPGASTIEEEPGAAKAEVLSPVTALASVLDSLAAIRDFDQVRVESLSVFDKQYLHAGHVINEVPPPIAGQKRAWSNIRKGKQGRCFLIVRLERSGRTGYLLEILRNPGESYSTLFFRGDRGADIESADLMRLFNTIARRGAVPSDQELFDLALAVVHRIRHPSPGATPDAWGLLRRTILELL